MTRTDHILRSAAILACLTVSVANGQAPKPKPAQLSIDVTLQQQAAVLEKEVQSLRVEVAALHAQIQPMIDAQFYTVLTAWATCAAVAAALLAVWRQNRAAKKLAGLQLSLQLAAQWDAPDLQRKRAQLARILLADRQALDIDDTALVFFETLGNMTRRGLVDRELVWTTFSVDVCNYWAAVVHYVRHVRERFSEPALFEEMEALNKRFLDAERRRHGGTTSTFGSCDDAIVAFLRWESKRGEELVPTPMARIISPAAG